MPGGGSVRQPGFGVSFVPQTLVGRLDLEGFRNREAVLFVQERDHMEMVGAVLVSEKKPAILVRHDSRHSAVSQFLQTSGCVIRDAKTELVGRLLGKETSEGLQV